MYGYFLFFFVSFTKGKGSSFCDFLFAALDDVVLPKWDLPLTLLHSERPKLHRVLAVLSAVGLKKELALRGADLQIRGGIEDNSKIIFLVSQ